MAFRFRLSKVLEWYDRQHQLEASRLRQCAERAANAHRDLSHHRESRLASENQLLRLESLHGDDLRARELYRQTSMLQESRLIRICLEADKALETQRSAAISARQRVLLVEKLRDRKRDEFNLLANRELEEIAADSWLAGFARSLTESNNS